MARRKARKAGKAQPRPEPRWAPWVGVALLGLLAAGLYTKDLDDAASPYFDEKHYVRFAHLMAGGTWERECTVGGVRSDWPVNYEHPPLGKLAMAWSVSLFDTDDAVPDCQGGIGPNGTVRAQFYRTLRADGEPLAWRLPSAALGVAAVTFTALAARRLFSSTAAGLLAGSLALLDGVLFTSARVAMLDVYAAGFAMAAVWAATHPTPWGRAGAGLLLGLAVASKLTGLFALLPVLLVAAWCHHREGLLSWGALRRIAASLALLPLLVLLASYAPWWRIWVPRHGVAWAVGHWLEVQWAAVTWTGTGDISDAPYSAPAWTWFSLAHPVQYYSVTNLGNQRGHFAYIYTIGNPLLWWSAAAAALAVLALAARRGLRAWRAGARQDLLRAGAGTPAQQALVLACLLPALAYLPFLMLGRETYLFYATLLVPLLAIALAGALLHLWRSRRPAARWACGAVAFLALFAFLHFFPVLGGNDVSAAEAEAIFGVIPWMER